MSLVKVGLFFLRGHILPSLSCRLCDFNDRLGAFFSPLGFGWEVDVSAARLFGRWVDFRSLNFDQRLNKLRFDQNNFIGGLQQNFVRYFFFLLGFMFDLNWLDGWLILGRLILKSCGRKFPALLGGQDRLVEPFRAWYSVELLLLLLLCFLGDLLGHLNSI